MKLISHGKAQSATEFVLLVGATMFFFVALIGLIYISIEKKNYEKKDIALIVEAEYLSDEISLAYEGGPGYERTFQLPKTVLGKSYTIEIIEGKSIYVKTNDNKHAASITSLQVSYVKFDPSPTGEDRCRLPTYGDITIQNDKGTVKIINPVICLDPNP